MATRIGLITTGDCEHRALPGSLRRFFKEIDVEFVSVGARCSDSVTSRHLTYPAPTTGVPTLVDKLVARMTAEIERRDAPDFVVVIDDLELVNRATPQDVVALFRDSARRQLAQAPTHRRAERFQQRCSFHLFAPMLEAYFFGEPAALTRAGAKGPAFLDPTRPLEDFMSADIAYLASTTSALDAQHPKLYLRFLAAPGGYRETKGGCAALETLDWSQVFRHPADRLEFACSLFDDLCDALEVVSPLPTRGTQHLTARRSGGVMRNL